MTFAEQVGAADLCCNVLADSAGLPGQQGRRLVALWPVRNSHECMGLSEL